jgi:hypothetical protein
LNAYMTNEIAQAVTIKAGSGLLFISDIRTVINPKADSNSSFENKPTTTDIVWNTAQMYIWMKIMRPEASLLKFRLPFDAKGEVTNALVRTDLERAKLMGVDFTPLLTGGRLIFPNGIIYLQAWAPPSSTETRMMVKREDLDDVVQYPSLQEYEDRMFYFNAVQRRSVKNVQDVGLEKMIWTSYLTTNRSNLTVVQLMEEATKIIGKSKHAF